jgi:AraC-like DNA-binding protein
MEMDGPDAMLYFFAKRTGVCFMWQARDDARRLTAVNTLTYEIATPPDPVQLRCEFVFVDKHHSAQNGRTYAHPTPAWTRVFVLLRGRIELRLGAKTFVLRSPGIHLVPTSQPFVARYQVADMTTFHLDLTDDGGISATNAIAGVLSRMDAATARALIEQCRKGNDAVCQTHVFHVVMQLLATHLPAIAQQRKAFGPFRRLAGLVRAGVYDQLSVADLARMLNLPPAVLARRFRRACGMTLATYLARIRTEEAKKLIVYSTLPAAAIADKLGFSDRFYFYRFFKKQTGCSPTGYRRQHGVLVQAPTVR